MLASLAAFNFLICTVWTSKSLSQTTYLATGLTSSVVTHGAKIYFLDKMEGVNTANCFWMNCLFRSESDTWLWPRIRIRNIISKHTVVTGHPCGRLQLLHDGKIWFILEFLEDIYVMSNKFCFLFKALRTVGFLWEYLRYTIFIFFQTAERYIWLYIMFSSEKHLKCLLILTVTCIISFILSCSMKNWNKVRQQTCLCCIVVMLIRHTASYSAHRSVEKYSVCMFSH